LVSAQLKCKERYRGTQRSSTKREEKEKEEEEGRRKEGRRKEEEDLNCLHPNS